MRKINQSQLKNVRECYEILHSQTKCTTGSRIIMPNNNYKTVALSECSLFYDESDGFNDKSKADLIYYSVTDKPCILTSYERELDDFISVYNYKLRLFIKTEYLSEFSIIVSEDKNIIIISNDVMRYTIIGFKENRLAEVEAVLGKIEELKK